MNHLDFLELAHDLSCSQEEAARRSSISRGYYAVYHHIKEYLVQNALVVRKIRSKPIRFPHNKAHGFLNKTGLFLDDQALKTLSGQVEGLMVTREEADYEIHDQIVTVEDCETHILKCHMVVETFDQHSQDFIDGLTEYLTKTNQMPYRC